MMRLLRVHAVVAASAIVLAASESCARADSAGTPPHASVPVHDLELAGDSGIATPQTDAEDEEYVDPSCASAQTDDQQRCLSAYLARSDLVLDRHFQALILRLRTEAGATSVADEPPAVQRLRATQRAWVAYRDDTCRRRTLAREGELWAPVRARCLIDFSMQRVEELAGVLADRRARVPHARTGS
jgi:uncharacterized protein YecT (DUF1311 family)